MLIYAGPVAQLRLMPSSFLGLPTELRLNIYQFLLDDHLYIRNNAQPSNAHLRLLRTCRQVADEAISLRSYVSLSHEYQISTFIANADISYTSRIQTVDVANDGRVIKYRDQVSHRDDIDLIIISLLSTASAHHTIIRGFTLHDLSASSSRLRLHKRHPDS